MNNSPNAESTESDVLARLARLLHEVQFRPETARPKYSEIRKIVRQLKETRKAPAR